MIKIIRTSTVPQSLNCFCRGLFLALRKDGYEVVVVSSPGEELNEIAEREQVKTWAVQMERSISPLKDLRSLCGLIRVFRRERPRMVHSITPKAGLLSMIAAWCTGVPVRLHTFTGLVFPTSTGYKRTLLKQTDRLTCFFATHIVPEGEGVKADLLRHGITRKPLRVLGYGNVRGIDLDYYNPDDTDVRLRAQELKKAGTFTFVFVGRLVRDKGINELVEAFGRLNREHPDTRLILIGEREDHLDPVDKATIEEINNNASIHHVGFRKDVRPWLLASDAMVFPSYREGFPNAVIEAGAMGLPVVATDINGSNEIIIEGENGIIVPSKNADALYHAMRELVRNPDKTERLASKARQLVASRYEQRFVRQCLKDYYQEILEE